MVITQGVLVKCRTHQQCLRVPILQHTETLRCSQWVSMSGFSVVHMKKRKADSKTDSFVLFLQVHTHTHTPICSPCRLWPSLEPHPSPKTFTEGDGRPLLSPRPPPIPWFLLPVADSRGARVGPSPQSLCSGGLMTCKVPAL